MDEENLRLKQEDIKRKKSIEEKAANPHFNPGSIHAKRYVDPLDYDRWEKARIQRKSKNHTLDPYR